MNKWLKFECAKLGGVTENKKQIVFILKKQRDLSSVVKEARDRYTFRSKGKEVSNETTEKTEPDFNPRAEALVQQMCEQLENEQSTSQGQQNLLFFIDLRPFQFDLWKN